jgi:hypothetical protein
MLEVRKINENMTRKDRKHMVLLKKIRLHAQSLDLMRGHVRMVVTLKTEVLARKKYNFENSWVVSGAGQA